ncbi:MAG TPA: hypothetical protein VLX85_12095, partial [Stellaceae bacterium]|nr:hypothetical protein [Stellaceae bacterium]
MAATGRIKAVAEVSAEVFTAMHNLRTDRATTRRDLENEPLPYDAPKQERLKGMRMAEMPALRAAALHLATIDIAGRDRLLPKLQEEIAALTTAQERTWDALMRPKSERPQGMGKAFFDEETELLDTLDKVSERLTAAIKNSDPIIDRMMAMKQLAWMVRNTGGDASLTISNAMPSGHGTPPSSPRARRCGAPSKTRA